MLFNRKVYLIPGLGADARMYQPQLQVLPHAQVLEHMAVLPRESFYEYAQRLSERIDHTQPFVLIGTSLGGMLSLEMARHVKPEKILLLSTVKGRHEMPHFIRAMRYVKLHRLVSGKTYIGFNNILAKRLHSRGEGHIAEVILQMAAAADPQFIEWAIEQVVHWQPPVHTHIPIVHIHGTKDTLFPYRRIREGIPVTGGSHVMNMQLPDVVNSLILQALNT